MAPALKQYTKDKLMAILRKKCPDALAKFPAPESFEIKMNKRGGVNNPALRVGHTVTKKNRKIKDVVWLEEYDSEKGTTQIPRDNPGIQIGNAGPMAGYDLIFRPAYGAEARNDYKLQQLYMGMHYSTEDDFKVNLKILNAKGFKGDGIFGNFTDRGTGSVSCPFSNQMKALFRFILLHCGHTTVYEEFEDVNGKAQGPKALVSGLKKITKNILAAEEAEAEAEERSGSEEQDDALFVKEGGGKKRAFEDQGGETVESKKARTNA